MHGTDPVKPVSAPGRTKNMNHLTRQNGEEQSSAKATVHANGAGNLEVEVTRKGHSRKFRQEKWAEADIFGVDENTRQGVAIRVGAEYGTG